MSWPESARAGPLVLCAGIAVYDQVFGVDAVPAVGAKARARTLAVMPGGCAANAAIAIRRLGGRARLISPLGGPAKEDPVGDTILAGLDREDIDCSHVIRVGGAHSPISSIMIDEQGERTICNYRDEKLSAARILDLASVLEGVSTVLVDNRFPEMVIPLCEAARASNLPVVLDADQPTRLTEEFLRLATHIIFPADGLRATAACDDLPLALLRIAGTSAAFLAVTDGANGTTWVAAEGTRHLPACAVAAVDTLGAGDVFHGAFALCLAEGYEQETALRFANAAAALKCTRFGGIAGAPSRAEMDDFYRCA